MRIVRLASALAVICVLLAPADAVVNQVDGLVVPVQEATCPGDQDVCIQTGLNFGEGINPPSSPPTSPGPVHAILDANTGPETFLIPRNGTTFVQVTFRLLQEGAGFENIFGWYNVEDPTKRYPAVFSCRGGNRSTFEPPSYNGTTPPVLTGGYTFTIDFQAEFAAGRYLGKQIGFYLISPEGSANRNSGNSRNNCATDPSDLGTLTSGGPIDDDNYNEPDGHDDDNGFGRIYYTESKLNNDGNYVHYLIYQSKQDPKHFYFGFEDLFRGGDNDYDDTLVKVEGLIPTCQPQAEVCNGVDDNCNGAVDENLFRECTSACGKGQERCQFTNDGNATNDWVGCTATAPQTETCNGLDDDCDGTPDNNLGPLPACRLGTCSGQMSCVAGQLVCNAPKPSTEICDGKDNDCDTRVDEDLSRLCSNACGVGVETCNFTDDGNATNDWQGCTAPKPGVEICDGLDNDCDGKVDNGVAGEGQPCDHASGNTCSKGTTKCVGGKVICIGATTGGAEICDCKDNNCNGEIDEGNPCPVGTGCVECGCRIKCGGVEFGCPKDHRCKSGYCVPDKCAAVSCGPNDRCVDGVCKPLCDDVQCPTGKVCRAGSCVEDSCYGKGCPTGELCSEGRCITDPCAKSVCAEGEYCTAGRCLKSCGRVLCGGGARCVEGRCTTDPCTGVSCAEGLHCEAGKCDEACTGISCGAGRVCRSGKCVDDPCLLVRCFGTGEVCQDGQCVSPSTATGIRRELLATGGGAGVCELSPGPPEGPPWPFLILLVLAGLASIRRGGGR